MTMSQAQQTFAQQSGQYALARPRYPQALYDWILSQCPGRAAAWDCATGNGQAAVGLAPHFGMVQATDLSAEQVRAGLRAPNVFYSAQPAEATAFADHTFDLITVAQALHWFDTARFWPEVRRVARPGALFCAWGYSWFECESEVAAEFALPLRALLEPFWAPNNRILWNGYRNEDIAFPYARLPAPPFVIEARWTIEEMIAYVQTWSAYKLARQDVRVAAELERLCGGARERFAARGTLAARMPLSVVAGRL
ncbi:class I SAM-dependent methyltransferase [Zemynaea arenosa]|nr:class I SAM-dependent methyltransferase [Massilia arenosa]